MDSSVASGFVAAGKSRQGRLFRKQILKLGRLRLPSGDHLTIDSEFLNSVVSNFNSGTVDHVQIPAALDDNSHTEDPERNLGEVVGLEANDKGLFALMDFRKSSSMDAPGSTILGASAALALDYKKTDTGEKVGPVLLHVCATNRPHVTGMEEYSELIAASSDLQEQEVVFLSSEEEAMPDTELKDLEGEALADALKERFGIADVAAWAASLVPEAAAKPAVSFEPSEAQLEAARAEGRKELVEALSAVLGGDSKVELSASTPETVELSQSVAKLAEENSALSAQVVELSRSAARAEVDSYVAKGFILPKAVEPMTEIFLSNREQFEALLPSEPIVPLDALGQETVELTGSASPEADEARVASEVARISKEHKLAKEKV